jgi:hypothetical protein
LYQDAEGFVDLHDFEDPKLYPDGIIERFLRNLPSSNLNLHIVRHFHESVNDKQIEEIKKYFSSFRFHLPIDLYGSDRHWDMLTEVFHDRYGKMVEELVVIGIEKDYFWNQYRIVRVVVIDRESRRVEEIIYRID